MTPFEQLDRSTSCKMSPPNRDDLLPVKADKHVAFDPELQYYEFQDNRSKKKNLSIRRPHILLLSLFLGLLFYSHFWRVSLSNCHCLAVTLTAPDSILTTRQITQS